MTVVVGLKNNDSVIVATDREENDRYLRNDVVKIAVHNLKKGWTAGFAGAGDAAFIDYSVQQLEERLSECKKLTSGIFRRTVESELSSIFTKHIDARNIPDPDLRPNFSFVISAQSGSDVFLFSTHLSSVREEKDRGFFCIGVGEAFARSLLNRYWGVYSTRGATLLALYVVRQTKKYIRDVGGGTDILIQTRKGKLAVLTPSLTGPIEIMLDDLDREFERAFFGAMCIDGHWKSSVLHFDMNTTVYLERISKEIDRLFKTFHLD
jgi:20S proteasome alpha/beta subunit